MCPIIEFQQPLTTCTIDVRCLNSLVSTGEISSLPAYAWFFSLGLENFDTETQAITVSSLMCFSLRCGFHFHSVLVSEIAPKFTPKGVLLSSV
jgi:hypothetical protein